MSASPISVSLRSCPIPGAAGCLQPEGTGTNGVLLLGEAMGDSELVDNLPFRPFGEAGSVLERAIRRLGMTREQFVLWNAVPTHPPKNDLAGAPYEAAALEWGRPYLEEVIAHFKPRVILSLGNIATRVATGLVGSKLGVTHLSGLLMPSRYRDIGTIPCFHPAYLRRGKMSHLGVLIRALKFAAIAARDHLAPVVPNPDEPPTGYIVAPTEQACASYLGGLQPHEWLAYDIETPYSDHEDSAEEEEGEQPIKSIQFSRGPGSGIFLPWRYPFIDHAKRALASPNKKMSWNGWRFDDPILRANGCTIAGESHDLMWLWHHLNPDLPRNLQFAAVQCGWPFAWKHLDAASPAFYGIVDVDVLHFLAGVSK